MIWRTDQWHRMSVIQTVMRFSCPGALLKALVLLGVLGAATSLPHRLGVQEDPFSVATQNLHLLQVWLLAGGTT